MTDASVEILNGQAQGQLRGLVERIERLNDDKQQVTDDIKEVYAEAKSFGFHATIIRAVVRLRKEDKAKRQEKETLIDLYLAALGGL